MNTYTMSLNQCEHVDISIYHHIRFMLLSLENNHQFGTVRRKMNDGEKTNWRTETNLTFQFEKEYVYIYASIKPEFYFRPKEIELFSFFIKRDIDEINEIWIQKNTAS
jgi:hypothetical protein